MKKRKWKKKLIKVGLYKAIPLWMVIVLTIQSTSVLGIIEYYFLRQNFNQQVVALSKATKSPEEPALILKQHVLPQSGYTLGVTWNDIGQQLLSSGVIDQQKYDQLFSQDPGNNKMMQYLTNASHDHMMISEANSLFMVNTLWALGLVNKNKLLDDGMMQKYEQGDPMQYASTGGWNLGSKDTSELYSSQTITQLTEKQQALVEKIASSVYRPCCGNPTSFPDCNHGMAVLGYVELGVKQGLSEQRIYRDVLALNSFWFPQQYVTIAAYFNKQHTDWDKVDAKRALSQQYSSAQGVQVIAQQVQNIPGLNSQGGSC